MRTSSIGKPSGDDYDVWRDRWIAQLCEEFWTTKCSAYNLAKKYEITVKLMYKIVGEQYPEYCYPNSTVLREEYHLGYRREQEKLKHKNTGARRRYKLDDLISRKNIIDLRDIIVYK